MKFPISKKKGLMKSNFHHCAILLALFSSGFTQSVWEWQQPFPQGNTLRSVTYGNNEFVAAGCYGTILTSPNGETWTLQFSGTTDSLCSVAFCNNQFAAVGDGGTILTSPDGVSWALQSSGQKKRLNSVIFSNNKLVTVGDSGTILISPDGISWSVQSSGTKYHLHSIAFGNNLFAAVGDNGTILTSPDGTSWSIRSSGTKYHLRSIAFGDNLFVAVGDSGTLLVSSDCVNWKDRGFNYFKTDYYLYSITYDNNKFVVAGGINNKTSGIIAIYDTSDRIAEPSIPGRSLYSITYGNNRFVAVGRWGTIITSSDLKMWSILWQETEIHSNNAITYANDQFIMIAGQACIRTSSGKTWTHIYTGDPNAILTSITYGNNLYVAVGKDAKILTSPDGIKWTQQPLKTPFLGFHFSSVTFGSNKFVAVGYYKYNEGSFAGFVCTSPDGVSWTIDRWPGLPRLTSVTHGNNLFVAVGRSGEILVLKEGDTNWVGPASLTDQTLYSVVYGNNQFVAMAYGFTLTSPDGENWTKWPLETDLGGVVTYGNHLFVNVGGLGGAISTSPDGAIWTKARWTNRYTGTEFGLNSVAYGNNLFVAVGDYGTILTSKADAVGIFPNNIAEEPAHAFKIITLSHKFFIHLPNSRNGNKPVRIVFLSVAGKIVYTAELKTTNGVIDIPTARLSNGMYLIKITDELDIKYFGSIAIAR